MRTTIDIDDLVLKELKRLQQQEGTTLGKLVSELLTESLEQRGTGKPKRQPLRWNSKAMGARVDLTDKDDLRNA